MASTLGIRQLVGPQDEQDYLALLDASVADLEAVAALPSYTHPALLPKKRQSTTATAAGEDEDEERTYREPAPGENPLNGWRFRVYIPSPLFFPFPPPLFVHKHLSSNGQCHHPLVRLPMAYGPRTDKTSCCCCWYAPP